MAIELQGIHKSFGPQPVISDLSLTVQTGELFVLLGSSGSGKSTVLRLIAGLLVPDRGSIMLHGSDVTHLPPQKRNTGFVFQNYAIFRHMTVAENVAFGLRIRRVSGAERRTRASELLDLVGLGGLEKRYPSELSGGQRQRVALARALAYEPAVLLLDEPFGALDARIRAQLRRSLKEIQRHLHITSILVTHDQEEAFELADRIGVIERGRLIEVGAAEDLYHRPRMEYTATFLGGGNVLVGRAEKGGLRLGQNLLPFPEGAPPHDDGAPVRVLFRPECVRVRDVAIEPDEEGISLGQGILTEKTFGGGYERLRFTLETLRGVRPLSPAPLYGQPYASVEALLPSEARIDRRRLMLGEQLWLDVPALHVLEPSGLKLLVCVDATEHDHHVIRITERIQSASHGPTSALLIAGEHEVIDSGRNELETACSPLLRAGIRFDMKVRHGNPKHEVIREAQEHFYDLAVLSPESYGDEKMVMAIARRLLASVGIPVLIASPRPPDLTSILVCLAADQSDSAIVRFAARLARHTRSQVTILHVFQDRASETEQKPRVLRHLEQAQKTFMSYGISSAIRLESGALNHVLVRTALEQEYGMLLMGAPAARSKSTTAVEVVRGAHIAAAIVPMGE